MSVMQTSCHRDYSARQVYIVSVMQTSCHRDYSARQVHIVSVMQTSRHRDYSARQVYEAEHGICQLCQFDAEAFYKRLR